MKGYIKLENDEERNSTNARYKALGIKMGLFFFCDHLESAILDIWNSPQENKTKKTKIVRLHSVIFEKIAYLTILLNSFLITE